MAIQRFLAMTAAEIGTFSSNTPVGWMACHFSPYGLGLSNLPTALPKGSLLIVDDITPMDKHDPKTICRQLAACIEALSCSAVLLDFQRPGCEKTAMLAKHLSQTLPCPAAVSALYGDHTAGPVFLPPVPLTSSLAACLAPWQGREIWLDMALTGETITVTEDGSAVAELPFPHLEEPVFHHEGLHCHYRMEMEEDRVTFTLKRNREDLLALLAEAEDLGVTTAVGLYQELHSVGDGH